MIFTYYCILLANTNIVSSVADTRYKVLSSATEGDVNDVKAFRLPFLDDFLRKVVRLCCENNMDYLRFV